MFDLLINFAVLFLPLALPATSHPAQASHVTIYLPTLA